MSRKCLPHAAQELLNGVSSGGSSRCGATHGAGGGTSSTGTNSAGVVGSGGGGGSADGGGESGGGGFGDGDGAAAASAFPTSLAERVSAALGLSPRRDSSRRSA